MAKYSKDELLKIAQAKHIETEGLSDLELYQKATGLIHADEDFINDDDSDWYCPKGAAFEGEESNEETNEDDNNPEEPVNENEEPVNPNPSDDPNSTGGDEEGNNDNDNDQPLTPDNDTDPYQTPEPDPENSELITEEP